MKKSINFENRVTLLKQLYPFLLLLAILLASSCAPDFLAENFDSKTKKHTEIAILPFEMIYTGNMPRDLTREDLAIIQEKESEAFMISFYNQIHKSTRRKRRRLRVRLQPHNRTMEKLLADSISVADSWKMDSEELAELLGVDAVVRGRIEKTRLMSDYASLGVDIGVSILEEVLFPDNNIAIGGRPISRNKEVRASYSLIAEDGLLLWSTSNYSDADWTRGSDDLVDEINWCSARQFPYRKGKK